MRRFITCFGVACVVAVLAAGTAPGKNGQGVMCVLQHEADREERDHWLDLDR